MDSDTATRFVASLAQSIQALCHGYVDFHSSVEVIGHIYLNVDNGSKFNYIVNEEVSKFPPHNTNSTMFRTHSYYSVPPDTINNETHSCFQNLDTEILVVSKSGFLQKSTEWNSFSSLDKPVNLSSTPNSASNDKSIDYKRKPDPSLVAPELSSSYLFSKSQAASLVPANPKRKRKKSETKKYVNHVTLSNDIAVDDCVLNNNLEREDLACDNELLLSESNTTSYSPPEVKSVPAAQTSHVKKKRRKSEPSKCIPHVSMKDPETNDNIFVLKNNVDESYHSTAVNSEFADEDEYCLVKKEILLNTDFDEPNIDFKDSLPYSSTSDQALELIQNSSVNYQRDSSLLDTLNTSFSSSTKTITAQLRHQIVEYANIVGNRPAARHFGVHESSIRHWRKRFIYGDAAVKKKKKKKELDLIDKEIENVQMVESPLSVSS